MRQLLIFILTVFTVSQITAQSASVSPSRLYYKVAPGGYKTEKIRVTNNGSTPQTFQVGFFNFSSNGKQGKTSIDTVANASGCSNWLTASPSFFELAPGATQEVELLIQVPNTPDANTVRWAVASVKIARENKGLEKGADVKSAMEIIPTFQFLVHVFQTPPNVTYKEATIMKFEELVSEDADSTNKFKMEISNTGETILDCYSTIELMNPETGDEYFIKAERAFTLLPKGQKVLEFIVPKDVKPGKYEVFGWVEYGSTEHFAKTETLEIVVK